MAYERRQNELEFLFSDDYSGHCFNCLNFCDLLGEYGTYSVMTSPKDAAFKIQAEIYARGPVAAGVNAEPLVEYTGGIVTDTHFWHKMVWS